METVIANDDDGDIYADYRNQYRRLIADIHSVLIRAGRFGGRK